MFNQSCGCQCNNMSQCCGGCSDTMNGCPRPQPLVAPRRVCVTNQITPVPQPVICPIECRRVNRCMYFPVFYPQYEQTFVTLPGNFPGSTFNESQMDMPINNRAC